MCDLHDHLDADDPEEVAERNWRSFKERWEASEPPVTGDDS